ncbi:hypothetical protein HBI70_239340 [Parastagonospora nodorum]|nr:hypothetical protein HBH53_054450 [Parastagonospora nodorum]KAH3994840.1 hypothetical protein HBI10_180590 [Parastagonospora nodorum]KAH4015020.1 hypothetical protein HBI13_165720 [Parastagonospora nodorum]KAH5010983.1 hypothetical protein HBI74_199210 [Parastagonospora nodorum]KAH5243735.1 hypothetical protein HBI70_239340 [Parastagonospora nodorum]
MIHVSHILRRKFFRRAIFASLDTTPQIVWVRHRPSLTRPNLPLSRLSWEPERKVQIGNGKCGDPTVKRGSRPDYGKRKDLEARLVEPSQHRARGVKWSTACFVGKAQRLRRPIPGEAG